MPLEEYRKKRDFKKTPEPAGEVRPAGGSSYCIQKHAASRLHYDLRLELDGVLLSWAIPKGPSFDPRDKRLAMHVEDHPVEYGSFEGVIPEGEYGAGTVVLWDRGTWTPVIDPVRGMKKGELKFELHGEKLAGKWALVKIKGDKDEKAWLLVKDKDEHAKSSSELDIVSARPESVVTARGLAEVAAERDRLWHSKSVGPGGKVNPGGPAEGEDREKLRPRRPRGSRARPAATDAAAGPGDGRRDTAGRRRVAARDQARRLPDRGAPRGRRRAARLAQRQGLDEGVPGDRPRRSTTAGGYRDDRRRSRGGAGERSDQLPGVAEPRLGRSGAARVLRLRPVAPRRLGPPARSAARTERKSSSACWREPRRSCA
jgi:DNA ligase D-like protein (predicted 3'-phosphoesterase)